MNPHFSQDFLGECKTKLLCSKKELLERMIKIQSELNSLEKGGDEADRTVELLQENRHLNDQKMVREKLLEIEQALSRIEKGTFGVCEETFEPHCLPV